MSKGEIKRDYRYWPDWNLIGSCWYGRLFILGINVLWVGLITYWIIDCIVGLSTGRYPIK